MSIWVCECRWCVEIYVPTPCPLSPLPSVLLTGLLRVGNEEERHLPPTHTRMHASLSLPWTIISSSNTEKFYPHFTLKWLYFKVLPTNTYTISNKWAVPGISAFQTPSWTASPKNLLDLLLIPFFSPNRTSHSLKFNQLKVLLPPKWTDPINMAHLIAALCCHKTHINNQNPTLHTFSHACPCSLGLWVILVF